MRNSWLHRLGIGLLVLGLHGTARATLTIYLELPGVNGESNAPGEPDVILLDSLSLGASEFDATKLVDSTSAALASAALTGTPYSSASLFFYDDVANDATPDAGLLLQTAFVTSIQPVSLGGDPGEAVSFAFALPSLSLFLELPGVSGESSMPGHAGIIAVDSISLSGNGFSVLKTVDSTSTALATAALSGTPYATATLLFYANVLPQAQPEFALVYQNALVSSLVSVPSGGTPKEDVSFAGAGVVVAAPEPSALGLLGAALAVGVAAATTRSGRGARRPPRPALLRGPEGRADG